VHGGMDSLHRRAPVIPATVFIRLLDHHGRFLSEGVVSLCGSSNWEAICCGAFSYGSHLAQPMTENGTQAAQKSCR
jgi:hypothetical protein